MKLKGIYIYRKIKTRSATPANILLNNFFFGMIIENNATQKKVNIHQVSSPFTKASEDS